MVRKFAMVAIAALAVFALAGPAMGNYSCEYGKEKHCETTTTTSQETTTTEEETTTTSIADTTTTTAGTTTSSVANTTITTEGTTSTTQATTTTDPSTTTTSSTLPFTGMDTGQKIGLGASALAFGALLVFAARRGEENG